MVLQPDQQRVCTMLKDTITLLCKNGLAFKNKFSIEAVIGVTLDDKDMFHISMSEVVKSLTAADSEDSDDTSMNGEAATKELKHRRRKRPRVKRERSGSEASGDGAQSDEGSLAGNEPDSEIPTPAKMQKIKGEPADLEDPDEDDLVFVKQEMDENWSSSQNNSNFPDFSNAQSQDQNFSSLSDMTLVPVGQGMDSSGWSPGMSPRQQQYRPRIQRTSTVTSGPGGGMQSQIQPNDGQQLGADEQQASKPEATWVCTICGKQYASKLRLSTHEKTHYGIYTYHCPLCNKGFMASNDMRGHMSWHTGVKEFKCDLCDKEFRYKQHLVRHGRTSHGLE